MNGRIAAAACAALAALAGLPGVALAQQSQLVKVEPDPTRTEINRLITVRITVGSPGEKIWCGAVVTFGDGESRELRIDQSPYTLTKSYKSTGSYTISVVGKFVERFLKSASGCAGSIASEHIVVEDTAAAAAQAEAQHASQAEFERLKKELEQARAEQAQRATTAPATPTYAPAPPSRPSVATPARRKPPSPAPGASDSRPI